MLLFIYFVHFVTVCVAVYDTICYCGVTNATLLLLVSIAMTWFVWLLYFVELFVLSVCVLLTASALLMLMLPRMFMLFVYVILSVRSLFGYACVGYIVVVVIY